MATQSKTLLSTATRNKAFWKDTIGLKDNVIDYLSDKQSITNVEDLNGLTEKNWELICKAAQSDGVSIPIGKLKLLMATSKAVYYWKMAGYALTKENMEVDII